MDLITMAQEILSVKQTYPRHIDYKDLQKRSIKYIREDDFDIHIFEQMWGNTSGGFEGIGGSAMTVQNTYVLIPKNFEHDCLVFFAGRFAYKVPYSEKFMDDVLNRSILGKSNYSKYNIQKGDDNYG